MMIEAIGRLNVPEYNRNVKEPDTETRETGGASDTKSTSVGDPQYQGPGPHQTATPPPQQRCFMPVWSWI